MKIGIRPEAGVAGTAVPTRAERLLMVEVPNLVDLSLTEARDTAHEFFTVVTTEDADPRVPNSQVRIFEQRPASGQWMRAGSTITVWFDRH